MLRGCFFYETHEEFGLSHQEAQMKDDHTVRIKIKGELTNPGLVENGHHKQLPSMILHKKSTVSISNNSPKTFGKFYLSDAERCGARVTYGTPGCFCTKFHVSLLDSNMLKMYKLLNWPKTYVLLFSLGLKPAEEENT